MSLPIIWFGIKTATIAPVTGEFQLGDPLIFKLLRDYLRPDLPADAVLNKNNPLLMAGWVGMLITGLNMLPISQLDGGHVIYGLFGRKALSGGPHVSDRGDPVRRAGRALQLDGDAGAGDPAGRRPSADARRQRAAGFLATAIGLASLGIPVLCFTPVLL